MSSASQHAAPSGTPAAMTLIRTGRLLDVRAASVLEGMALLVSGERIAAVIPAGAPEPAHDHAIDLGGYTVLPGLIDCHTHLIGPHTSGGVTAVDLPPDVDLLHGVANARNTLEAGFTTVRDVGTARAFHDVRLRHGIEAGLIPGPRMLCAGVYVTSAGGGADPDAVASDTDDGARRNAGDRGAEPDDLHRGLVGSVSDARRVVDDLAAGGANLVKIIVTGGGVVTRATDPDALELAPDVVAAIVESATGHGLTVAAAAHGAPGMELAARCGVRTIEHGTFATAAALDAMAAAGTYLVIDLYTGPWIDARSHGFGWSDEIIDRNVAITRAKVATFGAALRRGVRIAFGTDSGVYPHGENAAQFSEMVAAGMTSWQAIQSATFVAAELLRADADIGTLEPGRYADLVATAGDPLADIGELIRPRVVVKGGTVVAGLA